VLNRQLCFGAREAEDFFALVGLGLVKPGLGIDLKPLQERAKCRQTPKSVWYQFLLVLLFKSVHDSAHRPAATLSVRAHGLEQFPGGAKEVPDMDGFSGVRQRIPGEDIPCHPRGNGQDERPPVGWM